MLLLGQNDIYLKDKSYAGIGSRSTPDNVLDLMHRISFGLSLSGYTLRSGGAIRADSAFEEGVRKAFVVKPSAGDCEIFRPHNYKNLRSTDLVLKDNYLERAMKIAERVHPAWNKCNDYARALHARNAGIILGADLKSPVKAIICWTPEDEKGQVSGGTGLAIRIGREYGIRIDNLWRPKILKIWKKDLAKEEAEK